MAPIEEQRPRVQTRPRITSSLEDRVRIGKRLMSAPPGPLTLALLCLWLFGAPVAGQNRSLLDTYAPPENAGGEATLGPNTLEERARRQREITERTSIGAPLEGALDPEIYTIGPNDLFSIAIGGVQPLAALVPVSSDGYLVLTGIERIFVAGRTLAEAESEIDRVLRVNFRNVPVNVALAQPRSFYVHVTGAVPEPRRYLAQPVSRVADVLEQAFLLETSNPSTSGGGFQPALRNIDILHRDGTRSAVDLVAYYRSGDVSQNPYLMDGDAIHVPAFRPSQSGVFVDGEIAFAGTYDFREGDTILSLLRIGAGQTDVTPIQTVRHTRRLTDGRSETRSYEVVDLIANDVPLRPLDNVHVPHPLVRTGAATAEGAVRFPGTYPIEEGRTTLRDLVQMAGGLREDALLHAAFLVRDDPTDQPRRQEPTQIGSRGPYVMLEDTSAVQQDLRLSTLDYFGRNHLARELLHQNRLSVDVATTLDPNAPDFPLPDGARLVVPRDENMVRVLGQVVRPGGLTYRGPLNASEYIEAAGGRGPRSSSAFVLKAGTGQWLPAKKAGIQSGDVIFVTRKGDQPTNQEVARLLLQRDDVNLRTIQVAFTAVSAVTAIVTTALFIRQELRR